VAFMSCVRPTRFGALSRVPPALPAGVMVEQRGGVGLGRGATIGVGVGAAVGGLFVVVGGVVAWVVRRRRKRERMEDGNGSLRKGGGFGVGEGEASELQQKDRVELLGTAPVHEIKGDWGSAKEKSRGGILEVQGTRTNWELEGHWHFVDRTGGSPREMG
jgi:hypothetical protein